MDFLTYAKGVKARTAQHLGILNKKYWYLPRSIVSNLYLTGYEAGVEETTRINVLMSEMIDNGADPDDLIAEMEFVMITETM